MFLDLKSVDVVSGQHLLTSAIAPRLIALVSTLNKNGGLNLAPFSYFNLFSADPPVVIVSVTTRLRDNTTKHTLENIYHVPELVIHICDYAMVQQMNITSADYPDDFMNVKRQDSRPHAPS